MATDIAIIDVPQLVNADLAVATTLAHAFRLAGTQLLSLDSREVGSFVMSTDSGPNCGLVLFDTMPGGAGHGRVEAARLCGVSPASWDRLSAAGKNPGALKLGGRVLWKRTDLLRWIAHDCPNRKAFASLISVDQD